MDTVKRSAVTPCKSRVFRAVAKVLHFQDDGIHKTKSHQKAKKDQFEVPSFEDENEELQNRMIEEAFLSQLFAGISAVKAAYAELQFAQSPYNADRIQSADKAVISELMHLSELKQKKKLNVISPVTTLLLSEIHEQKSTLKIYEITAKKLDYLLKHKDSKIQSLKEKLAEANKCNKSLEKKLNSSGQLVIPDIRPVYFISYYQQTLKSIHSFARLLTTEMESAGWDLDAAAKSIEPNASFKKPSHKCFAFESFVSKQMFDGFNWPDFSSHNLMPERDKQRGLFFERFTELKPVKPADYLALKPKSPFAAFCQTKYLRLVHPKMESSLFGSLDQRNAVALRDFPATPFFSAFAEMAKRVWLLHCLALSFDPEISIFHVKKGSRFCEVYMLSVNHEVDGTAEIAFCLVPGFKIGKTVLQCRVYLC